MQNSSRMVRHALLMMTGTLISRVLGLIREVVTAAFFGATRQLDAFNVAYTLANLARQLVAEGALSAAFVPVFSKALTTGKEQALSLARQAMSVLIAAALALSVLGILGAPFLTFVMAPGFDAPTAALATSLTRWMFPFLFFVSMAALAMGTLNSLGSFFVPALAPAFSNLTFILATPFLVSRFGIYGLAFAVLAGGFMHFFTQWLWGQRIGATLYPQRPDFSNPDLRRMMALFLPYAAGLSLNQLNPVISRMLGSFLEEGDISVLNYANRIIQLPLGLFVIAISQAVLPQLSRAQSREQYVEVIVSALRFAFFIVMPATLGLVLISGELVHLIFVRGAFGAKAWHATARALALSSWGLPGMACTTVIMRGLYALSLPRAAFTTTLFSVGSTALFSVALMLPMGYGGLALAPSLAFTLSSAAGLYYLRRGIDGVEPATPASQLSLPRSLALWGLKITVALAALSATVLLHCKFIPYDAEASFSSRMTWSLGVISLAVAAYSCVTLLLKCEEWQWIIEAVKRKKSAQN